MDYAKAKLAWIGSDLTAVICGSFRRDPDALRSDFDRLLEAGCKVVSPADVDFVEEVDGFVYGEGERGKSTADIEQHHLRSMEKADLVWLHCPDGYVGTSAAMELGFARAVGIRVFAAETPGDVALADLVQLCDSPRAAVEIVSQDLGEAPSHALPALQNYYARAAQKRGWSEETGAATLDLLRGEIDELEEALSGPDHEAVRLELADVQLYVIHLANVLGAELGEAVCAKEKINTARFSASPEQIAA